MKAGAPSSAAVLSGIPDSLRDQLLSAFADILRNFKERRWEPSELNGGKFCEIVYTILRGYVDGVFPATASKPANMVDACKALENAPAAFARSVRIQIPRMLIALYEIRNNRGVGHVGGDVNPNHMDAVCVLEQVKWILSELVRLFHNVSTEEARAVVESLTERTIPLIWEVGKRFRVLDPTMKMRDKVLVLLYQRAGPVDERDLFDWVEHSNAAAFRRDVLRRAHKARLLEYDSQSRTVVISPLGIREVENVILPGSATGSLA